MTAANLPVLKVAVVGHTNTGKTSLMRTLTRDVNFGEVSDRPATTRHVEGTMLVIDGRPLIELYDTPGLEDSSALLEFLNSQHQPRRTDWIEQIQSFLDGPAAHGRFAQEAKAIRQVRSSDVALYVIDARDRVLGKHRDELEILARCAKPIVPVLNFIASPEAQTALWREHLSRANMHAVAEFDTVALDEHGERRLLEKMRTLLDRHHATLSALIEERGKQRQRLIRASADLVADMLIDEAAFAVLTPVGDSAKTAAAVDELKQRVRDREQQCVERLLELHRFRPGDFQSGAVPLADGRWGIDLFSPAAMKQFGVRTGGGAAAGAMVGLTVDAMVGGMSLGAATAVGAAIGALLGAGQTHGKRLFHQARGRSELRCDDATLRLLWARQVSLIQALLGRGHASIDPIRLNLKVDDRTTAISPRRLLAELDEAKIRPQWSRLMPNSDPVAMASPARRASQDRLATLVAQVLH